MSFSLIIEGVSIPAPSSYLTSHQDLTKILRNARGTMIGEFISRKAKIEMSWSYINGDNLAAILNAIEPLFFNVTYWDQKTKSYKTSLFYKGDRTIPLMNSLASTPEYKDFAVNLIER